MGVCVEGGTSLEMPLFFFFFLTMLCVSVCGIPARYPRLPCLDPCTVAWLLFFLARFFISLLILFGEVGISSGKSEKRTNFEQNKG